MTFYQFPIILQGEGSSPEEAWEHAIECFSVDPGIYSTYEKQTEEEIINDLKIIICKTCGKKFVITAGIIDKQICPHCGKYGA